MVGATSGTYRVLHIAQKLPGGVGAYLAEVLPYQLKAIGEERLRVSVAETDKFVLPNLPEQCLHCFANSDRTPAALFAFALSARRAIVSAKPDIVHLHSTYAGLLRGVIATIPRSVRPAVVYCAHGWAFNMQWSRLKRSFFAAIEKALAPLTDRILCISRFELERALARGLPAVKMEVLYNGVSSAVEPGSVRPAAMPRNKLNLLFIGRQDEQKGLDIAEAAMAMLHDFPVHLHVIGSAVVDSGANERSNSANVTYYGWQARDSIWSFIEAVDAVLVPSRWEGFGLAAIEAMRQAKPVLASRVDALPEVIHEGVSGVLFQSADPAALAELVRSLEPPVLHAMGLNARQEFLERFTGERMNREILAVYDKVLYARGGRAQREGI